LEPDDEPPSFYAFPVTLFREAVQLGRVELLAEIIRRTGAGLPLENLVKQTGMEMKVKPRYYQGLTVYGSKRYVFRETGLPALVLTFGDSGGIGPKRAEEARRTELRVFGSRPSCSPLWMQTSRA
jgi:hypothetical protein